ncbi:MAG TPA: (Fe-S)-binding protein [Conexivisphaerales archaeon]|nr:(Fe-S)-binding protein [Conexivisphaerales archaeon]
MGATREEVVKEFERCTDCYACLRHCPSYQGFEKGFLRSLTTSLELGTVDVDDAIIAYRCTYCGFCATQCPYGVSVMDLMMAVREAYVSSGQGPLAAHTPLYVNRKVNFFSLLDGSSHIKKEYPARADRIFFPGCSLRGYRPEMMEKVAHQLGDPYVMRYECCGKPLKVIGARAEYEKHHRSVVELLKRLQPSEIITACPNCYGNFKEDVGFAKLTFAAEALLNALPPSKTEGRADLGTVAIHDSCPYRATPELFDVSRSFVDRFYHGKRVELKYSRDALLCCGAGGAVSYSDEALAKEGARVRTRDAKEHSADTIVTFCNSCGVQLGAVTRESGVRVVHAFDLLDGSGLPDYEALYKRSKSQFSGPCLVENLVRLSVQI